MRHMMVMASFALGAFLAATVAVKAQDDRKPFSEGDVLFLQAGCQTYEDAVHLFERFERDGDRGYNEVLRDPRTSCIDRRVHPMPPTQAVVSSILEDTAEHADTGAIFNMIEVEVFSPPLGTAYTWQVVGRSAPGEDA